MRQLLRGAATALLVSTSATGGAQAPMTSRDLLALPQPPADETIAYGTGPQPAP